ncbi:MAG: hypothetical protein KR126chlam3_01374 [Chlamydiae bacterium]|nr:hypothetical protein [Chlamydiota bacterium]
MKNLFSACILFFSTCLPILVNANEPIVAPEDKVRVELFLKHVLLEEHGIYTLLGSKPMSAFPYVPIIDEREKKELYSMQTEQFRKYISFEKFRPTREDARKLWNDWKKVEHKYLGDQYLIQEDEDFGGGFLINILSVTYILNKHYEDFEKIVREPFDPEKVVYRIGNGLDPLWKKIKKNHFLLGLLFGFGEKNSKYFNWEQQKKIHCPQRRSSCFSPAGSGLPAHELTIEDLDLPAFVSYQVIDEQVEKYRMERDRCIELFTGKDFCELAVSIMKGNPPQPPKKELSEEAMRLIREKSGYNSR